MAILLQRATRSDVHSDVRQGKASPARRLVGPRHRPPQQRLHSWPGRLDPADVEGVFVAAGREERAIEIALHRLGLTIAEHVHPLRQRLLHVCAGGVVELAERGLPGVDLNHFATGSLSLATQFRDHYAGARTFTLRP